MTRTFVFLLLAAFGLDVTYTNSVWSQDGQPVLVRDAYAAPSVDPLCCATERCPAWYGEKDYLLWRVNRSGLDVGIYDLDADDDMGPGQIVRIQPDYDSGFRLAFGRHTSSGWDFAVRWTRLDLGDSTSFEDYTEYSEPTRIHPSDSANIGDDDVGFAQSSYDVDLNFVDIEMGYTIDFRRASFRPFGGIRLADINQAMLTYYTDFDDRFDDDFTRVAETIGMDSVGFYFGSGVHVPLIDRRLDLLGRLATGVHISEFDSAFREADFDDIDTFDDFNFRVSGAERQGVGSLEVSVGLLMHLWQGRRLVVDLAAGYEMQSYFNMVDFISFDDDMALANLDRGSANLTLDGTFLRMVTTY